MYLQGRTPVLTGVEAHHARRSFEYTCKAPILITERLLVLKSFKESVVMIVFLA